jgi:hypothetical protein
VSSTVCKTSTGTNYKKQSWDAKIIKTSAVALEQKPLLRAQSLNLCPNGMTSCGGNVCAASFWGLDGCTVFASRAGKSLCN